MHKHVRAALAAVLLTAGWTHAAASADVPAPTPLSLDAAIALALDRNTGYRIAHTFVVAARARLGATAAPQRPNLSLRDNFAYANPVAELSTPFGALPFSATTATNVPQLTLQYQLFDGGRNAAQVSQAAADLAGAQAQERAARMALIDTTAKAYFDLLAATQSAVVADAAVDAAQAHARDAQRSFSAGQVAHADVLQAETEVASERVQALGTRNAIALAQIALDHALGVPLGNLYAPTDPLDAGAPDIALETLLSAARANRGDIAAAQAAVDAATYALKEARAARAPRVGLELSDGNVQPAVVPGYRNQVSFGLNAVWTLFDGGASAGQIVAAQAGIDRAKLALEQSRSDAELQVRQAALNLGDAKARVSASQAYVGLAAENLRLAQVRYRGGVGTVLELQDAEFRTTTARQALIAAEVAVREGIVHVRFSAGLL